MTDDDHDHDPADYDAPNEVDDGDGSVFHRFSIFDLMALMRWGRQAVQRPPRARRQSLKAGEHFLKRSEIAPQFWFDASSDQKISSHVS